MLKQTIFNNYPPHFAIIPYVSIVCKQPSRHPPPIPLYINQSCHRNPSPCVSRIAGFQACAITASPAPPLSTHKVNHFPTNSQITENFTYFLVNLKKSSVFAFKNKIQATLRRCRRRVAFSGYIRADIILPRDQRPTAAERDGDSYCNATVR